MGPVYAYVRAKSISKICLPREATRRHAAKAKIRARSRYLFYGVASNFDHLSIGNGKEKIASNRYYE